MSVVSKSQVSLSGWVGGPGLMTFYGATQLGDVPDSTQLTEFMTQLRSMFDSLKTYLAPGVTAEFPVEHRAIDVDSGNLVGVVSSSPIATVVGTGSTASLSRATQAKLQYITDGIRGNRIVRGGPFFGPLSDQAMTNSGLIAPAMITAVPTAHGGLLDIVGMRLVVYSVPFVATKPDEVDKPGQRSFVQQAGVWNVPGTLRSRRD